MRILNRIRMLIDWIASSAYGGNELVLSFTCLSCTTASQHRELQHVTPATHDWIATPVSDGLAKTRFDRFALYSVLNGMKLVLVAMFALLLLNSTAYAESAYTLTEVDEPGANVITKYIYDSVSGEVTPVYYEVSLNKTAYGEGDSSLTFTVNGINGGTYVITGNYSVNNLHSRITGNTGGEDVQGNFVELSATEGGAISNSGTAVMSAATVAIGNITGDFISNYANNSGGAIYNFGVSTMASATVTIGDINGDFIGNYAFSSVGSIY